MVLGEVIMSKRKSSTQRFIKQFNPTLFTPFTSKDWTDRLEEIGHDTGMLFGYMDCVNRIVPAIDKILEKAKDFDELKNELTKFSEQQKAFRRSVERKWENNPDSQDDYGLPSLCL